MHSIVVSELVSEIGGSGSFSLVFRPTFWTKKQKERSLVEFKVSRVSCESHLSIIDEF